MKRIVVVILLLWTLLLPPIAAARNDMSLADSVPVAQSPQAAVEPLDTIAAPQAAARRGIKGLFQRIRDKVMEKINEPYDTVRDKGYWWRALKHGNVNLEDTTYHYPGIIRFGYKVYKWEQRVFNSYDSTYVKSVKEKVRFTVKNNNWMDNYHCRLESKDNLTFYSNATSNIGLYFSLMGFSLGYSMDVNHIFGGKKTSRKMEISFATSRFTFDYYRMLNTGAMTLELKEAKTGELFKVRHFHGMKRKSWGIRSYYIFNHLRYAHAAPYSFSKYQLRSAGSFLAGVRIMHQNFTFDASKMTPEERERFEFEEDEKETPFNYTDYCLSGGYGYNCVLGRHWVFNCTAVLDMGLKRTSPVSTEDNPGNYFVLNGKLRLAFTYSHKRYFASVQGYLDSNLFNTGYYRFGSHLLDVTAALGVRF